MRILIKIWWNVIAPKGTDNYNQDVLQKISSLLPSWNIYHITNGTGNVGHWFVKSNIMNKDNIAILQDMLHIYESKIDKELPYCTRIQYKDMNNDFSNTSLIIWWTILDNGVIVSSDLITNQLAEKYEYDYIILLSNVDWVLDETWQIIPQITPSTFDSIHFWSNENDVTWSMKSKIQELLSINNNKKAPIWIINGFHLERLVDILHNRKCLWTMINNSF